ncbi:MAG: transcription-repair coupling factor [Lachnospirales bacterium]
MGYERCEMVEGQGQFALRGGILDIFSSVNTHAVRIELWGDEVDSIRILDTVSQRSIENAKSIKIYPMRELVYHNDDVEKAIDNIKSELKAIKNKSDQLKISTDEAIEKLSTLRSFSGVEKYFTYFYSETSTLIDYFDNPIIFVDEPNRVQEHCKFITNEFVNSIESRIDKGTMLPNQLNMIYTYDDIIIKVENNTSVLMTSLMTTLNDYKPKELVDFQVKATALVKNDMNLIAEDLGYLCKNDYKIIFLAGGHTHCERMLLDLQERGLSAVYLENIENVQIQQGIIYITRGSLSHGFEYIRDKFAVVSEKDAFSESKKSKRKQKNKSKDGVAIQNISDLKVGDYVVHENHGIGIFKGIEQIITDGVSKDYIKIGYAKEDVLYVAINQMDMVQKYIGGEATKPKLNRLGGASWEKAKARAKQAAYISAKELVELYAERQKVHGFKYSADTLWQREFEEEFEYDETDDQLTSIAEIKEDMESGKVMDRLLCGDVGFGKTEVAIRAAFKTVQDSKQVAYLVPTTILARQHYMTFAERMENYPIHIEMMSRFRTPKQQKETIENLKTGKTDIVIGTHRILSKDMNFKDLGLVIIDEEQRFGVKHKDKLKELRKNVNVLTLSATPIPRTLHMSMTGIRDMSVLAEPPNERIPIQTYVLDYDPECIKDAIHRELARNGQVYFLHNRVTNIAETTAKLQALVPEARFAFAHGQMSQRELEDIMMDFMDGEIDVLVCTTIIETGLDIPNVNTIIISDADRMGLSQLYQLRGRVGRSTRTSYAYLMYARNKVLNTDAEKRLQTIKEFTEFGSGFRVAMKDLEIRGAGNLLGAEQHGHMDSVGYELYCKLLNEAVMELKGETVVTEFETLIDIKLNAFIPPAYIASEEQKLEMYKKISLISNLDDYYDVQEELEDRYGDIPRAVNNLIDVAYVKAEAHKIGAVNVKQIKDKVLIYFKTDANVSGEKLMKLIGESRGRILFTSTGGEPYLTYKLKDEKHILDEIKTLIKEISA